MESDLQLDLQLICTDDEANEENKRVTLAVSPDIRTGDDFLRVIEERLQIPRPLMKLEFNSVALRADTSLDSLKLRNGDAFTLRYFSRADCRQINRCVDVMMKLQEDVKKWTNHDISGFRMCLRDLCYTHFSPWHSPEKKANKFYFVSLNGISIVTRLLDRLLSTPSSELSSELHNLETELVDTLWKLAIDDSCWQPLVKSGAVDSSTRALLRIPIHALQRLPFSCPEKNVICSSLGLLACFCEIPEVRLGIASNREAVEQMFSIALCPSFSGVDVHRVIMIFIGLSYNHDTHKHIVSHAAFSEFVKDTSASVRGHQLVQIILIRYHRAVLLAILLLSSPQFFSIEDKEFIQRMLDVFFMRNDYLTLSQFEHVRGIYWGTSIPLVKALYEKRKPELDAKAFNTCKLTLLLAMKTLAFEKNHHSVLVKEEMIDYFVCLPWHCEGELHDEAVKLLHIVRLIPELKQYVAPSLLNMSKAAVAMHYCGLHDVTRLSVPELVGNLLGLQ